ncbi:MAG: anti-sigma factor [Proteobacteria bacterium]|nr:anti-sigma factor [Pseudomonadota bacterium]
MSCKQASRLISQQEDFPLPGWKRLLLRLHLAACDGCTRFARQIAVLREAMARYRT